MGASPYAWIIDIDHLADSSSDEAGTVGPHDAAGDDKDALASHYPNRHQFRMYDDDEELYYTGTLFWIGDAEPEEEFTYGPLGDFGTPNAGAVSVRYTDKSSWDCG